MLARFSLRTRKPGRTGIRTNYLVLRGAGAGTGAGARNDACLTKRLPALQVNGIVANYLGTHVVSTVVVRDSITGRLVGTSPTRTWHTCSCNNLANHDIRRAAGG